MGQETLNAFIFIFLALITVCIVAISFFLIQALRSVVKLADEINDTTQALKNKFQFRVLAALPSILLGIVKNLRRR